MAFQTLRLSVESEFINAQPPTGFYHQLLSILTPVVTQDLPKSWQEIDSLEKARQWSEQRLDEGLVLGGSSGINIAGAALILELFDENNRLKMKIDDHTNAVFKDL